MIPTAAALRFVGAATFEALSGQPVHHSVFADVPEVPHVRFGQQADLVVVAPATADLLARAAHGRADDLLSRHLADRALPGAAGAGHAHRDVGAPRHPGQRRSAALPRGDRRRTRRPVGSPGRTPGPGRLPEPAEIVELARLLLERPDALPRDLAGRRVVVSAGGTREPLDPVRFIGNRSSGRQGFAVAAVAAQRGATVTLVAAHTAADLDRPAGVELVRVSTAEQLGTAVLKTATGADAVVMTAAVADFRPAAAAEYKIKKGSADPEPIRLVRNPDILTELVASRRPSQVIVGFAAETGDAEGDVLHYGRLKLAAKGCDLLVVNAVGDGRAFGTADNAGWLLAADGSEVTLPAGSKALLASRLWDAVSARLP